MKSKYINNHVFHHDLVANLSGSYPCTKDALKEGLVALRLKLSAWHVILAVVEALRMDQIPK